MGKVLIVLLLLFGGCAFLQHLETNARMEREAAASAERSKAAASEAATVAAAAAVIAKARGDSFPQKREQILIDTRKFVAEKNWRLANQELEPWISHIPKDDPAFTPLLAKIAAGLKALEKRESAIAAAELRKARKRAGAVIGMTMEEVVASSWGRPSAINATTSARGNTYQWVYENGYLYFGVDGKLYSIQQRFGR
jgi:hypothetical protein